MKAKLAPKGILVLSLLLSPCAWAGVAATPKPAAAVRAAKGPVEITLEIYKTKVKATKSLWYRITLKNISKDKIKIEDNIFRDPWGMYENSMGKRGIYLELVGPKGNSPVIRPHGGWVHEEYMDRPVTAEDKKDLENEKERWTREGLTDQQRHLAALAWQRKWNQKAKIAELRDPSKQRWLAPQQSTSTFAWAFFDPDEDADHTSDEAQVGNYTQLWTYYLSMPGRYRVRAVYEYGVPPEIEKIGKEAGVSDDSWQVNLKTSYIPFQVVK